MLNLVIKPVYHAAFLSKILKILRCVCFHCSKLLVDPNDPKILDIVKKTKGQYRRRLAFVFDICKAQKNCKDLSSDIFYKFILNILFLKKKGSESENSNEVTIK